MKNFKTIITTNKDAKVGLKQKKLVIQFPFDLEVEIDKNNQIHNIQPRTFANVDLFSKYHGRTSDWCTELVQEMINLSSEIND